MRKLRLVICVGALAVMVAATSSYGSATIFLSPVTSVGGGAALGNPNLTVNTGESFALGVWVSAPADLTVNGLALDIVETAGLLHADGMEIMEAGPAFNRWLDANSGDLNVSGVELFANSNAIGGLGDSQGLTGSAFFRSFDANYDAAVGSDGAFLHAVLYLTAGPTEGATDLFLRVGSKKIGYAPDTDKMINFGAGDGSISREVAGNMSSLADGTINVIPEPATMGLLVIGGLAVLLRRRRR